MGGDKPQAITGVFTLVPNPCTTRPCLPGMAWAVVVGDTPYFLAKDGKLCRQNDAWDGSAPAPGALVTATGTVKEEYDINHCLFRTLEPTSLQTQEQAGSEGG
jgi:hypothetical protein